MVQTVFDKYDRWQDYHWAEYRRGTVYSDHARHVRAIVTERRILDVGGGDGLIASMLARKGIEVEVVDTNPLAVALARRHGVAARVGTAYHLTGQYEAVYCGDTLEHLNYPWLALWQFARVAPLCYIATPPRQAAGLHDHRHTREWTPSELTRYMGRHGWDELWQTVQHARILGKYRRKGWGRRCLSVLWPSA